jgi:hypothetical protein
MALLMDILQWMVQVTYVGAETLWRGNINYSPFTEETTVIREQDEFVSF